MSFTSDFLEEEKKKKKKKEEKGTTGDSFTDEFLAYEAEEVDEQEEDIAPLRDKLPLPTKPIKTTNNSGWFTGGAFSDGYQFGDITKTILGTINDVSENVTQAVADATENLVDTVAYSVGHVGGIFSKDFQEDVGEFIARDYSKEAGEFVNKNVLTPQGLTAKLILGGDTDANSLLGEKSEGIVQSGSHLVGQAALQMVGVPWWATSAVNSFGSEIESALNEDATFGEAGFSGAITAGAEILTEKLFSGFKFQGKAVTDVMTDSLTRKISSKAVRSLTKLGIDVLGEGGEEILSGAMSALGQKLTYADEKEFNELFSTEDAFDAFIGGAILSAGGGAVQNVQSHKAGKDYVSGLSENEEKVVNKVFEQELKNEEQKKGKKLNVFEKDKLYDDIKEDLSRGRISTDTIEEVLGGKDYKAYKDTVDSEDALRKEFDELGNKTNPTLADQSRYTELKQQLADIEQNSKRGELKNTLSKNVYDSIRQINKFGNRVDGGLLESYNEKARRGQAFDADLSKYDAKQQKVIKSAIDSGILNNTNRTHEFVDLVAKVSADKGVPFDFTNNQKLKDSGFAIEGKQVNGFVTKDGVTLNIDSRKSLNRVVGHEISHVLEGTELYGELSKAITEYAKSKGDYQGRYDTLTKLYEGVKDADIDAELTADLVGDYLFTDEDFINNLSTKHRNVFQKVYDEIKYLCKVATAGSKEARELERVKKAFEKAYKAQGKAKGDTKYSISDKNIKDVSTGYASGESYYTMSYTQDGKVVGTLEYGEYDGAPNVKMVEVDPEYRRKGIATKLLQELQNKYPDTEIDFGMSTPDGTKLLDAITYDVTDEAIVADRQRLKDLQTELNDLQAKLDSLYELVDDGKDFTEAQDKELDELGDRWQEVYESIGKLEKELRGKRTTKTFVKTDTKYSLSDSDGKTLTKEQGEYFKDSKVRDDNGNLKVMYHGSQDAGFHIFDPSMSDDGISLFFVDRNDVASSYSGTSETYEAQTINSAEDMNKFIESIGVEGYEVVEKDGKFTLLYEGDRVADSTTAKGIYEEFCWYEGVGEGDANYKVYLNLTNPLEIDAKGRPWNKIDAEFSQEVYDRYNSLTAEEKEALVDLAEWEDFRMFNSEIQEARGDALASAYEKMGDDCNIYDLFSVAADNFSEDSMRENARKYLKTRDFAQRANEGGYDGVIIKNVHDNGGYSNGSEGASTVAIAFKSEQVKSVANDSPTGDPDIRYSLSEYTAEEKKAHNKAVVDHFGKTYSWAETGYLLLDGTRLDLSGKHDGAPGGYRTVDHRDITEALGYDYGGGDYSGSLVQFMSEGNIRIIPECNGINLSVKPTEAQEQALSNYISRFRGEVMLDIDDLNGNTVVSVEYPYGTYYTKVLNDIREWFDNGKKPENAGNYSLTKEGETERRFGSYDVRGEDLRFDAPVAESVAPTVDDTVALTDEEADDQAFREAFPPMEHSSIYEQDIEAIQAEMQDINDQYIELLEAGKEDEAYALIGRIDELIEKGRELDTKARGLRAQEDSDREGYLNSLDDTDVPAEMEAPYYTERDSVTLNNKTLQNVTKKASDALFGLDAKDSAKMAQIVQKYAKGDITADELFDEVKREFQYSEEISNNEDILKSAKKHIRKTKIFVPPRLKAEFNGKYNDGFNAFRKEHFGHFTIVTDPTKSALKIDQLYGELNELFPGLFSDEVLNEADQLQEIAEICTAAPTVESRTAPYDDGTVQEVVDIINDGVNEYLQNETLHRLDQDRESFYESVGVEEDIAPTFDSTSKAQIKGQQTMFEDAPIAEAPIKAETKTQAPADEPKIAKVLESTPKEQKKGNLGKKVREVVVDKQSSIEDLSLKTKNRELMAKADFMLRSESRAQAHIKDKLMPILKKVEATGNRQAFEEYAYHLHNIDRMSLEGKAQARLKELEAKFGPLMEDQIKAIAAKEITENTTERTATTIREAREWLNLLEVKNKPVFADEVTADKSREFVKNFEAKNPHARELADALNEYNSELRQILVDNGVISQETADHWAETYPHYMPIRRAGKNGPAVNVALDSKRTGVDAPIRRATGGNSDMESLLDVMASRTEQVYRAIARNNFGLELMHTLDTVVDTQATTIDEVLDTFDNNYDELLKEGKNGENPTFTVFENGKRVTFDITEDLYNALKPTNELFKTDVPVMGFLTKLQRGLLTQYNPTFIATNAIKDIQDVLINSQHSAATYANVPLAVKELIKGGRWITEYMNNGGEDLTYFDSRKQVFKGEDGTVKKVLGFVPEKIAQANDFVEKIPRLAEYIASRKSGASVEVAMLDAARVTTNFAAGGDLTKWANRNGFTFLNASVQGAAQQVRNIREAKANGLKGGLQLAAKYAIAGLPFILLNSLRWDDDEDYEELSDYVKDNYYIVAKTENGKFVRIPKGRVVAVIQSAFEQMKNLITGDDEVDMARFGQLLVENIAPNNPLDNNVLAPIGQAISNKTWYGGDLVPQRLQDMPTAEQYDETTDSISKWLGEKTDLSPYKINYVLDQYSGGIGDSLLPYLTPESDGNILAPFADKFTTDSTMKNQYVSDFYDTVDELVKNSNSMNATEEDTLKSKYMNSISSEIGELYAEKREIQNSNLSDKAKDAAVREIQRQIDDLAKESLDKYSTIDYQTARDGEYANIGNRYFKKNDKGEWVKLDDDAVTKYKVTSAVGDAPYATDGENHFRWYEPSEDAGEDAEAGWRRVTDKELERQNEVTSGLRITPEEYWGNKEEYSYAYDYPGKYAVSKAVGGYKAYKSYSSELYDIKADKDEDGKSISGSRKEKVIDWINNLDADYGTKIILFKSEYNADDTYNYEIIDYLNSRDDISYSDMETILKELGFTVDSEGNIYWD